MTSTPEPNPNPGETDPAREGLTTEQLATAGAPKRNDEPRAFDEPAQGHAQDKQPQNQAAGASPLLPTSEAADLRRAWQDIQGGFVDEPRRAVENADHLVAQAMKRLAEVFAEERKRLESQWDRGDDVDTEDLRVALQRYRSFFDRLLTI